MFNLSYQNTETISFTIDPNYGNLNYIPYKLTRTQLKQPRKLKRSTPQHTRTVVPLYWVSCFMSQFLQEGNGVMLDKPWSLDDKHLGTLNSKPSDVTLNSEP